MNANRLAYIICIVLNLCPLILLPYFVTQDGPVHTYNAYILQQLLSGADNIYTQLHTINVSPEPNLSGHYLMATIMYLMSPFLAEKFLLAIYITGFALSSRFLLKQVSINYKVYSFLVFPFIYSSILFLGFYNFLIGVTGSLFFFALFIKWYREHSWMRWLALCLLLTLTWFSHLVPFIWCGIFAGLYFSIKVVEEPKGRWGSILFKLILIFLPGLLLSINYFFSQDAGSSGIQSVNLMARAEGLIFRMEPLGFMGYSEGTYIITLLLLLAVMLNGFRTGSDRFTREAIILCCASLLIYFLIPDAMAGGSYVVPRMGLYFFLMLMVLLSQAVVTKLSKVLVIFYVVVAQLLLVFRYSEARHYSDAAERFLSHYVEPGNRFFTLRADPVLQLPDGHHSHSQVWVTYHLDSYFALKNQCVNLRNYEIHLDSGRSYFATLWREGNKAGLLKPLNLGEKSTEIINFDQYNRKYNHSLRYLLTYAENDPWHDSLKQIIPSDYKLVISSDKDFVRVYERPVTSKQP